MTIIELLVVIAIAAILLGIAAPSFNAIIQRNRLASEANSLVADLQYARGLAIKEGLPVTACVSTDGTSCSTASKDWAQGWIVFSDPNANHVVDGTETSKWRAQPAFGTQDTLGNATTTFVTYSRDGFLTPIGNDLKLTLQTTPANANAARCITINKVGRLAVANGACS